LGPLSLYTKYFRRIVAVFLCLFLCHNVFGQENRSKLDSITAKLNISGQDSSRVHLLNKLSQLYSATDQDSTFKYGQQAKLLAERLRFNNGLGDALINLAHYYQKKGEYSTAVEHVLTAMKKYEAVKSTNRIAGAYLDLAKISKNISGSRRTEQYIDIALSYADTGYQMYRRLLDTPGILNGLITKGIIYRDKSITTKEPSYYDSAFHQYMSALSIIQHSGAVKSFLPTLYNNISQVYIENKKDYRKALDYLFKAVEINTAEGKKLSLSYNYGNISNAYIQLNDNVNGLKYAKMSLSVSQELNLPERVQNALYQVFQAFRSMKQWDSAHDYYILADGLNDSLTNTYKAKQFNELQTRYEAGKKEAAITKLNIENEHNNKRIVLLIVALVVFVALAIGLVVLYSRMNKQKKEITVQSVKLELVMKELHHRVKNNLQIVSSLLSLQSYKLEDEATISVLKESQMRVQAMSLIHQRLYKTDTLTNVNIKDYVTDLVETLMSAYGYTHDSFDLEVNITKEIIDVDKALPIGLIINELVTNAMKYAYKEVSRPLLHIGLVERDGNIVLKVKDNGPGMDELEWKKKTGSFGKQLITALSKQLRGKQSVTSSGGTIFTVVIPL
jgi:two-component sensor histidine kinase